MMKRYVLTILTGIFTIGFGIMTVTTPVVALGEGGAPAGIKTVQIGRASCRERV